MLAAGATTALVAIALTVYAITTKVAIQIFVVWYEGLCRDSCGSEADAMIWVLYLAMLPMTLLSFFLRIPGLHILYLALGLIFYSLFLIIDTIMICKSVELQKKHGYGAVITFDDYVIGAL